MSEKIIKETLQGLGLTEKDTQVYIYIAKSGPTTARDITKTVKITKAQVYRSLKNLQAKASPIQLLTPLKNSPQNPSNKSSTCTSK